MEFEVGVELWEVEEGVLVRKKLRGRGNGGVVEIEGGEGLRTGRASVRMSAR